MIRLAHHLNRIRSTTTLLALAGLAGGCTQLGPAKAPRETAEQRTTRMRWWSEARFGMFIHWGPVSLQGTEIGWSRGADRPGRNGKGPVPVEVYDNLYRQFNPVEFNADEWVKIARDAGMKYMVFTTKHHDGFCNFDTKLTDYKITSPASPYRRDIVRQLADACHRAGMRIGFYYSPPDWYHPDYRGKHHARYVKYMHGQLRELCTNYGKVDIIWFDGLGGTAADWDAERLEAMIRQLQPGIIINNRAGLPADFDTPEQRIGAFQYDRPWETCMTICNQWSWKPDDQMKSLRQCVQTLVRAAGGDGNLLFNVGPMPDGKIEPRQAARLAEMGAWLRRYGLTIYGTRGGPFKWDLCGSAPLVATRAGDAVYLHVLDWESESVALPPIPARILKSSLLTGGEVQVRQTAGGITVNVPPQYRQEVDTIVVLQLDRGAADLPVTNLHAGAAAKVANSKASNIFKNDKGFAAEKAFDENDETRWATDAATHEAWLEADLGKSIAVDGIIVCEACGNRVQEFEVQCSADGGEWTTVHKGKTIGTRAILRFEPVTARRVRLNILKATEGPTIAELQVRTPG